MSGPLPITAELSRGCTAAVVIDSLSCGTSSGGVRVSEDIGLEEVRTLAREMTLKYRFIGLPRGGAKSGIRLPAGVSGAEKQELLHEFGRRFGPLIRAGLYYPGMDMNCGPEDLRALYRGAGITLGRVTDTSYFTALSVAEAVIACSGMLDHKGAPLTIAIEGFGSVGAYLAARLPAERFRISALSTLRGGVADRSGRGFPVPALSALRKEHGDALVEHMPGGRRIEREELLEAEVDLLLPSARTWVINEKNVERIRARCIVPIANAPYTAGAVEQLHRRGVLCLPGFVTNAGGVFASSLYDSGVPLERIEELSATQYRRIVALLVERAAKLNVSPVLLAETVALRRMSESDGNESQTSMRARIERKLKAKGWMPKTWYGRRFLSRFAQNLSRLERRLENL